MNDIPSRIILDVDTGIDDAMAIVFALNSPTVKLEALTTTYGNTVVESTTRNTLQILEAAGRGDVPVAVGASRSLTQPFEGGGEHIHGANGLGEVDLPPPGITPVDRWAPDTIIERVRASPGEITLVPVGPMTNVAHALMKAPDIASLVRQIVIMGGTIGHPGVPGIPSPMADANFWNDPEAARTVLRSGAPIVTVGMDVTMRTRLTSAMMDEIAAAGSPAAVACMQAARFYLAAYRKQYPGIDHCALHDPLAVAVAGDASLVGCEAMAVDIECRGELTRGQMIPDRRATGDVRPNAQVAMTVDAARFEALFLKTMSAVPAPS